MSDLEVVSLPNGQLAQNCYLVADRRTREAVIIDPGEEPAMFLAELDTRAWTLRAIWITHAHVDHILGVGAVKGATGVPIHLHPRDRGIYDALPQFRFHDDVAVCDFGTEKAEGFFNQRVHVLRMQDRL